MAGYLSRLGISDVYASPVWKAKKGSRHGYDVVDPTQINPELGGKEGFDRMIGAIKTQHLGLLQDIIPNHMAFDPENRFLMDIFEHGSCSKYHQFFDVDWNHPYENLKGKMLAPFLGELYGSCLEKGDIRLGFDQDGFHVRYYDWKLPLRIESYLKILTLDSTPLINRIPSGTGDAGKLAEVLERLDRMVEISISDERQNQAVLIKSRLWELYTDNTAVKEYLDSTVAKFNGVPGRPPSMNALDELLSDQIFRLSFWKVGNEELNYRRFFTINSLICLQIDKAEVFEHTHRLVSQLIDEGQVTGLRIDHVDGLYDPLEYLNRLRRRHADTYLIVEKIMDLHENLPDAMPVEGTTGYDFLNVVNGVFIDARHEKIMKRAYAAFTGAHSSYQELVSEKKRLFTGKYMAGDVDNLAHLLKRILNRSRYGRDFSMYALRRAIVEIMAQFPVYRSYMSEAHTSEEDQLRIKEAVARAQNNNAGLTYELSFIQNVLLLDFGPGIRDDEKADYYHFTKKFQQLSGPLMAKGAEDTTFYIYNQLISLNEVGGNPSVFGLSGEDFHEFMLKRARHWPHSLNATSTHDTKRGEDVRARLNVLSEIPQEWIRHVSRWNKINRKYKKTLGAVRAPDKNDEYFLYQTLIGAYPFEEETGPGFVERIKEYMIKAIREAKVHTAWIKPDSDYENACAGFVEELLRSNEDNEFLQAFLPFQKKIAAYGVFNSLSQLALKLTCPGVPDIYQGTELWDLHLVDPDNRRPVNYEKRMRFLKDLEGRPDQDNFLKELLVNCKDGRVKLFVLHEVLKARQTHRDLFSDGEYRPLKFQGPQADHLLGFARTNKEAWSLTVIPRFLTGIVKEHELPIGPDLWQETEVLLPPDAPREWTNVFTQESLNIEEETPAGRLLGHFPAALLIGKN